VRITIVHSFDDFTRGSAEMLHWKECVLSDQNNLNPNAIVMNPPNGSHWNAPIDWNQ
jgi:hypothetical protein